MLRRFAIASLCLALAAPPRAAAQDRAPSPAELQALFDRVIANQHRTDAQIEFYERIERRQVRKAAAAARPVEDKTFRVVPTGTGIIRAQVEENGRPVDAALYRRQLLDVEHALAAALRPSDPRQRQAIAKHERRVRERTALVDALRRAYRATWLGREQRNGRALAKIQLEPDPAFQPFSRTAEYLTHARATVWIDEAAGALVRVEAEIFRDISIGAGILAKIYRGSRIVMEQTEVAPGLWLPARYDYSFTGRKFLFGFSLFETTTNSSYRRIGPPAEALAAIRRELASPPTLPSSR